MSPELALADDHVALAAQHVARQKEIIASLKLGGHPTALAEELLELFEQSLGLHWAHRDHIIQTLEIAGSPDISHSP